MDQSHIGFFDPEQEFSILERHLPHWIQAGTLCFVTWRIADSLPAEVLVKLDLEITSTLTVNGLNPQSDWKAVLRSLPPADRGRIQWNLFRIRDRFLDAGYGKCWFARPDLSEIVVSSLLHFDQKRYYLTDLVVMPNHVHFIAAFPNEAEFLKQNTDLKRFIAREVNRSVNRTGDFWQADQFDHLIRSSEQFEYLREYIAQNPARAGLTEGAFRHFRKDMK